MPHLGEQPLYDAAGVGKLLFGGGANPALPTAPTQTKLTVFRCPSDLGPDLNPIRLNHAMSNYRSIAGPTTKGNFNANEDLGGVFFQNSRIRLLQITDGASNTLAIGECIFDEPTSKRAALWAGMTGDRDGGIWVSDVMWWIDESTAVINGSAPQAFSSRHRGGAFFGFCDGSVRFLFEGGNVNVIRYLAGRKDGVIINLDP